MTRREVAVVPFSGVATDDPLYSVRARARGWWGWSRWVALVSGDRVHSWPYAQARVLADQALANGWVPGEYSGEALPVVELDEETSSQLR